MLFPLHDLPNSWGSARIQRKFRTKSFHRAVATNNGVKWRYFDPVALTPRWKATCHSTLFFLLIQPLFSKGEVVGVGSMLWERFNERRCLLTENYKERKERKNLKGNKFFDSIFLYTDVSFELIQSFLVVLDKFDDFFSVFPKNVVASDVDTVQFDQLLQQHFIIELKLVFEVIFG